MEEILETSRNTQRLLGNTDTKLYSSLDKLQEQVAQLLSYGENQRAREVRRLRPNMHPMMFEEMFMMSREDMVDHETGSAVDPAPYFIPMMLSPLRDGMPWLYDAGWQLAVLLMSDSDRETKEQGVGRFRTLVRMLSHGHPMFRELVGNKDEMMAVRELPMLVDEMLSRYFDR
ncbi:MAG: hypothetical protein FWF43_07810 [Propionibacteriaceae bacterium]|nr:hypothetical protein [Propionibacteriaceae bacterium]